MPFQIAPLPVTSAARATWEAWSRAAKTEQRLALRARIVLQAAAGGRELHVILDNLNIHKPKHDRWLRRHRQVYIHYTPTHASWLNQIEIWFSILSRAALAPASFTAVSQVCEAIDAFIAAHNPTAHPFEWTKEVVHQVPLRPRYADLLK